MAQRFPTRSLPRGCCHACEVGVDPALCLRLIRQESRFRPMRAPALVLSGSMQVMLATARWTARRSGHALHRCADRRQVDQPGSFGTGYLKLVLDDSGGSQALAAAGTNAGPNWLRRWREGWS